jgi:hypothetical protein
MSGGRIGLAKCRNGGHEPATNKGRVEQTSSRVREFVRRLTPDELYRPETYRKLNVLWWVKPAGAIMPVRAAFNETSDSGADRFTMAMAPRYSDEPIPSWLPVVVAAKLYEPEGRALEIVRAERITPIGRQSLRRTCLFGGAMFDPRKDQFFKVLVEEAGRPSRGRARALRHGARPASGQRLR